jgi:CHAT domain-containing protein
MTDTRLSQRRHARPLVSRLMLALWLAAPPVFAQDAATMPAGSDANAELQVIASALARMQDTDTALSLSADGAALYDAEPVKLDGYAYCSQSVALAERGQFRRSVQAASKAMHVALQTGNSDLLAKAYRDLAIVFNYAGQLERAETFAQLALTKQAQDPAKVRGPAFKVLGDVRTRQQRYDEAVAAYAQALDASSERYRPLVQASLVNALILSGDTARAQTTLDALALPDDPALAFQQQRTRGRLLLAQHKPAEALALYQQLVATPVPGDEGNYRMWALDGVSQSEQALGHPQQAAQALDQAITAFDGVRARFRSDEFKMGLFSDFQGVFDRAVRLHAEAGEAEAAFDISERSRARALLDAIADRGTASADVTAPPVTAAQLRTQLHEDERVVAYHALDDKLLAWVASAQGVQQVSIALKRTDLARLVEAYRAAIIGLRPGAISAGDSIANLLIAPLNLQPGQRLVFVPHGPLHYLPFQALRVDGQYLIQRHPLSLAPSVSVATRLALRSRAAPPRLLAFGNPLVSPAVADPLPHAQEEVDHIATLFPRPQVFFEADATRARFEADAPKARIVHVAAHARADLADPLHSQILFADVDGKTHFLEAHDVLDLDLHDVALVTLSACESGLGKVTDGDEALGFTRSFLSAGSAALVASLWPVPDRETEKLMRTFYGDLRQGDDAQRAMQAGQLAVIANPDTNHPFYWAAFNLIGDWRLKVEK